MAGREGSMYPPHPLLCLFPPPPKPALGPCLSSLLPAMTFLPPSSLKLWLPSPSPLKPLPTPPLPPTPLTLLQARRLHPHYSLRHGAQLVQPCSSRTDPTTVGPGCATCYRLQQGQSLPMPEQE